MSAPDLAARYDRAPSTESYGPGSYPSMIGCAFGWPLRASTRIAPVNGLAGYGVGRSAFGAGITGPATQTNTGPAWPLPTLPTAAGPLSMIAAVHLSSTAERGSFCGVGAFADAGIHMGVGASTLDATGNNLVLLVGGVAWVASGVAIGTGSHVVAYVRDPGTATLIYVDGQLRATLANHANPLFGPTHFFHVGTINGRSTATSISAGVTVSVAAAFTRTLVAAEIAAIAANPLRMIRV